jgi:catechol-2,3-dioxygenase
MWFYMTRRFDEMLNWYEAVFETKVQYKNPAFAFLTYDDEHHRFAFANMSVMSPNGVETDAANKLGVNHVGYTYANLGELLETYDRLKQLGITPYWRVHHGVTLSVYYRDPDGNRMEFQVDCYANAEESALLHAKRRIRDESDWSGYRISDELFEKYKKGVPVCDTARPA